MVNQMVRRPIILHVVLTASSSEHIQQLHRLPVALRLMQRDMLQIPHRLPRRHIHKRLDRLQRIRMTFERLEVGMEPSRGDGRCKKRRERVA
jgi:hypothetical protein